MAATHEQGSSAQNKSTEETDHPSWYVSRKEIEENSPSRRDGIALNVENHIRRSYSSFLRDLGTDSRLDLPELIIATATVYCHRFFLRQSHAKNNAWVIAMACMLLACKVEENQRCLRNIVEVSSEICRKYVDIPPPTNIEGVLKMLSEMVLDGEKLVLETLNFDFCVDHPYQYLQGMAEKFQGSSKDEFDRYAKEVLNGAWLNTSLCLQHKPEHIAAAAIYLTEQRFKKSIKYESEKVFGHEFDVPIEHIKGIRNQMLEENRNINEPLSSEGLEVLGNFTRNQPSR